MSIKHILLLSYFGFFAAFVGKGQSWPVAEMAFEANGKQLVNGLAGGLNAPQFHSIDINRDGIIDLYVFDRDGNKSLAFEGVIDGDCQLYKYRGDWASHFPYMQEFAIPRDFTGDGVPDLFTYSLDGTAGMQLQQGFAVGDHLEFELVILDQNYKNVLAFEIGGNLSNLPVSRIDLPAIVDMDDDGDYDILSFPSSGGQMNYYKNLQVERGLPFNKTIYVLQDDCWGGFYESDFSEEIFLADNPGECATNLGGADTRHNGSTTMVWDPNRDGAADVLIGDFTSDRLVYLQNGATTQSAWMTSQDFRFPAYDQSVDLPTFLAAFYLDVTCDGKNDILVAPNIRNASYKTQNVLFYRNNGTDKDSFEFVQNDFLSETMVDLGKKAAPALVDLNADGWLDLVIGQEIENENPNAAVTALVTYLHNGQSTNPAYILDDIDYLNLSVYAAGSYAFAPVFADMDGDGDMDIIVGDAEGYLFYGENTAGPGQPIQIPTVEYGWMGIQPGQYVTPSVADMNGDGLPDLIIGEKNPNNDAMTQMVCGNINYFQNVGTSTNPQFISNPETSPNTNCLGRINTKYFTDANGFSAPAIYDTGDSLLLFVGNNGGTIGRYVVGAIGDVFLEIDSVYAGIDEGQYSMPAIGDIDQDDFIEMVVGNQRGGITIFDTPIRTDGSLSGIQPNTKTEEIQIYPNPIGSGQLLTIAKLSGAAELRIYSQAGQMEYHASIAGEQQLDISGLSAGLHIVVIKTKEALITKKIIILK